MPYSNVVDKIANVWQTFCRDAACLQYRFSATVKLYDLIRIKGLGADNLSRKKHYTPMKMLH